MRQKILAALFLSSCLAFILLGALAVGIAMLVEWAMVAVGLRHPTEDYYAKY